MTPFDPAALRSWRKRGGVSARKLACLLGVRVNLLWAWERGDACPGEVARSRLSELVESEPPQALRAEPRRRPPPRWTELSPADLRAWRYRRHVSRRSLACALGVSEGALCAWEYGRAVPSRATQRRLAEWLGGRKPCAPPPESCPAPRLGRKLTAWRKARGWSRRRLAEALGVSEAAVWGWEHRRTRPSEQLARRLSALLERGRPLVAARRRWELLTADELRLAFQVRSRVSVAEALQVSAEVVRGWETGLVVPSLSSQRRLRNLLTRPVGEPSQPARAAPVRPCSSALQELSRHADVAHDLDPLRAKGQASLDLAHADGQLEATLRGPQACR